MLIIRPYRKRFDDDIAKCSVCYAFLAYILNPNDEYAVKKDPNEYVLKPHLVILQDLSASKKAWERVRCTAVCTVGRSLTGKIT